MKVLHYVSIMNRAGQETFLMNMYRNVDRDKIQFGFLCSVEGAGDYDEEIFQLGGKIHYIQLNQKSGKLRHIDNYLRMRKEFSSYVEEYDVFHIHNYHAFDTYLAARAAVKAGFKKVIVHSHNASADGHLKLHELSKPLLAKLPVTRLACSSMAGKWMFQENDFFEVIPNGIDIENFKFEPKVRLDYRKKLGVEDKFVIGHVGRFDKQKNHHFLVNVFEKFAENKDDVQLLLIGRGELKDEIEAKVHEKNIQDKVSLLGVRNDVASIYQAMDCFFFPSLFEGLGIVVIEAQTAGLPCIISDNFPYEVDITKGIKRCSLNATIEEWVFALEEVYENYKKLERVDNSRQVKTAGFDELSSSKKLSSIYLE